MGCLYDRGFLIDVVTKRVTGYVGRALGVIQRGNESYAGAPLHIYQPGAVRDAGKSSCRLR